MGRAVRAANNIKARLRVRLQRSYDFNTERGGIRSTDTLLVMDNGLLILGC